MCDIAGYSLDESEVAELCEDMGIIADDKCAALKEVANSKWLGNWLRDTIAGAAASNVLGELTRHTALITETLPDERDIREMQGGKNLSMRVHRKRRLADLNNAIPYMATGAGLTSGIVIGARGRHKREHAKQMLRLKLERILEKRKRKQAEQAAQAAHAAHAARHTSADGEHETHRAHTARHTSADGEQKKRKKHKMHKPKVR